MDSSDEGGVEGGQGVVSRDYTSLLDVFSFYVGSVAAGKNEMSVFGLVPPLRLLRRFGNGGAAPEDASSGFQSDPRLGEKSNKRLGFVFCFLFLPPPANTQTLSLECVCPPPPPSCKDTWHRVAAEQEVEEVFGELGLLTCVPVTF